MGDERPIYGTRRMAEAIGESESTVGRWRRAPLGAFIEVGSMNNAGGGYGRAAMTLPSLLGAFQRLMGVSTREQRRRAARKRWGETDVSSGSSGRSSTASASGPGAF